MNSRERVLTALNHKIPDRIPRDFGSSNVSSIHRYTYEKLLEYLKIKDDDIKMMEKASQLVIPCEELLQYLDIDTRGVFVGHPKKNKTHIINENEYIDAWGVKFKCPKGGLYFDVSHSPLEEMETLDEIEKYKFPDITEVADDSGIKESVNKIKENGDYAIVGSFGSSIFMKVQQIRGYAKTLEDLLIDEDIAEYLLDKVLEIRLKSAELLINACGEELDIIEMADDLAGQNGLLLSKELYRKMIKPRTQKLIRFIKSKSNAKILYHSCGDVSSIIDELIDAGIDILNPIQVSAGNMGNIKDLKKRYGTVISFWGGIDSQIILPNGSPQNVVEAVRNTQSILGENGGYILCGSHNIQADVPVENVIALYKG